jgi:phenylacetate-coenzyme A ligase PaaK-like adenylate-forming protein
MIILRGVNVFPTRVEEIVLRTAGLAPHFQLVLTTEGRMDALTVRVEARPETPADRRRPAAAELVAAVKQTVGVRRGGARWSTRRPWSARWASSKRLRETSAAIDARRYQMASCGS